MKFFANKNIWKKIVIVFLIINIFNFTTPEPVSADLGGTLMSPIMSLFVGLADGVNTVINKFFLDQDPTIIPIRTGIQKPVLRFLAKTGKFVWSALTFEFNMKLALGKFIVRYVSSDDKEGATKELKKEYQKSAAIVANSLSDAELVLPSFKLTPYEIFSNKNNIFSVNIFEKKDKDDDTIISNFRNIVRDWYVTLRLIAIVSMMSVLVYIGIRVLISSTAEAKAKYKQMLWDWLIATCLIFIMHYIMIFANLLVDSVTELIDTIHVEVKDKNNNAITHINEQGVEGFFIGTKENDKGELEVDTQSNELVEQAYKTLIDENDKDSSNNYKNYFFKNINGEHANKSGEAKILFWPADDFMTQARMYAQKSKQEDGKEGDYKYIGYGLIYVVLTVYTIIFSWVYLRRLIYMIFLTLISPLVALTYPIDKVKDGQAQAFNFWFREYFYNLLLQPLHLLLYMLLIGSAMQFAAENPIYVVVALGFMVPAEKLIKTMFGFKGQTPGSLPGLAAGAMMMHATKRLFENVPRANHPDGHGGDGGSGRDENAPPKINSLKPHENNTLFNGNSTALNGGDTNNNEDNELEEQAQRNLDFVNDSDNLMDNSASTNSNAHINLPTNNVRTRENNNHNNNQNRRIGRLRATGRAAIHGVTGTVRGTLGSRRWRRNAAIRGIRGLSGAALGLTGATMGGIASIVGGDPSKAIEYMGLGGLAGYRFGTGVGESATNALSNARNAIDNEYYAGRPEEYARRQINEYIEDWRLDRNNIDTLRRNLGNEGMNELLHDRNGLRQYIESGFTDVKDIVAGEQFKNQYANFNTKDAIDVLQINKQIAGGDFTKLNPDEQDKWRKALRERFKKQGNNDVQAKRNAETAEEYLNAINNLRSAIK